MTDRDAALTDDEWRLVRLFRCMTAPEQNQALISAGQCLMRRLSVDPRSVR